MDVLIKIIVLSCVIFFVNSENVPDDPTNSLTVDNGNLANSSSMRSQSARTLYGLLGFLTGYRLGQGLGPTSYSSDIRESGHLNLFAKLFNSALVLTYEKYPHPYPFNTYPPMYNPSSPFRPFTDSSYPPHLHPHIWYPPIINPVVLPPGHNPVNQQQIINLHEPFNTEEAPNENYQELSGHNTQEIQNNFHSEVKPNDDAGPIETFEMQYFGNGKLTNKTQSKNKVLADCEKSKNCIEAIESESTSPNTIQDSTPTEELNITVGVAEDVSITEVNIINATESTGQINITESPNGTEGIGEKEQDDSLSTVQPSMFLPGPIMADNTGNIAPSVQNSTNNSVNTNPSIGHSKYPYPVYHFYGNFSKYEHISITESPLDNANNMRQLDYYEEPSSFVNNYLPLPDDGAALPFAAAPRVSETPSDIVEVHHNKETPPTNSFHPMGGSFYDSGRGYQTHIEKFNINQDDSEFVPMGTTNLV